MTDHLPRVPTVLNPEAIGDPSQTPLVELPPLPLEWSAPLIKDPAAGRFDRLLADQRAVLALQDAQASQTGPPDLLPARVVTEPAPNAEVLRLRAMVAALEAENAALTEALDAVSHDFRPSVVGYSWCASCGKFPDDPAHRTPTLVRAEYGLGAT